MITLGGVQYMPLKEILEKWTGRLQICDELLKQERERSIVDNTESYIRLDINKENFPYIIGECEIYFIPEEIFKVTALENSFDAMSSVQSYDVGGQMIATELSEIKDKIVAIRSKFALPESMYQADCYAFIYQEGQIIDVRMAIPNILLEKIYETVTEYQCCVCGKLHSLNLTSKDKPQVKYNVADQVYYYCDSHSPIYATKLEYIKDF